MNNEMFGAIALLLIGGTITAVFARRLISGKSYISNPPMAVSRDEDPFSFWLSIIFPACFGIALIIGGCLMLWRAIHPV